MPRLSKTSCPNKAHVPRSDNCFPRQSSSFIHKHNHKHNHDHCFDLDGSSSGQLSNVDLSVDQVSELESLMRAERAHLDSFTAFENGTVYRQFQQLPLVKQVWSAGQGNVINVDDIEQSTLGQLRLPNRIEKTENRSFGANRESPGATWMERCYWQLSQSQVQCQIGLQDSGTYLFAEPKKRKELHNSTDNEHHEELLFAIDKDVGEATCNGLSKNSSDTKISNESEIHESEFDETLHKKESVVNGASKRLRYEESSTTAARELQRRVCDDLLLTMPSAARRRVLRWAEKDFTWFDKGSDVMEIIATSSTMPCTRCSAIRDKQTICEESILLQLRNDMSWQRVRRMRHRHRKQTINEGTLQ